MAASDDLFIKFLYMINPDQISQKDSIYHIGAAFQNQQCGTTYCCMFENRLNEFPLLPRSTDWRMAKMPQLTVKTLAWLAQIDAPLEYQSWHQQWVRSVPPATDHATSAHLFYAQHWLTYTYTTKGWFKYNGLYWDPLTLKEWMSEIMAVFELGTNKELMSKLETPSFVSRMLKHLERLFEAPSAMDTDLNLLGLADGIIDFTRKPPLFRKPFPEDMVSAHSSFEFGSKRDPAFKEELEVWLDQIFEHWADLDRFLTSTARLLTGIKEVVIWRGVDSESNGRTTMCTLLQLILGATFERRVGTVYVKRIDLFYDSRGYRLLVIPTRGAAINIINYGSPHTMITFKGQWLDDPKLVPHDPADQYASRIFKRDPKFADRLHDLAPAFLDLLLQKYHSK